MSRRAVIAAAVATILIAAVTAAIAGRMAQGPASRPVIIVRTVPARTVIKWRTRTVTRTVTQSAPDPGALTCIQDLYVQLSSDAANGHVLPHGWWLANCDSYLN